MKIKRQMWQGLKDNQERLRQKLIELSDHIDEIEKRIGEDRAAYQSGTYELITHLQDRLTKQSNDRKRANTGKGQTS
jgi:hypothetical protein